VLLLVSAFGFIPFPTGTSSTGWSSSSMASGLSCRTSRRFREHFRS